MDARLEPYIEKIIELHKQSADYRFDWTNIDNSGWEGLSYKDIHTIRTRLTDLGVIVNDSTNNNHYTRLIKEDFSIEGQKIEQELANAPKKLAVKQLQDFPKMKLSRLITIIIAAIIAILTIGKLYLDNSSNK